MDQATIDLGVVRGSNDRCSATYSPGIVTVLVKTADGGSPGV
jgi:hypothetical protein